MPMHINMLEVELAEAQFRNAQFSMSQYAVVLGLSKSFLSELLSGKKALSYKKALEVVNNLKWSERKKKVFLLSVKCKQSSDPVFEKEYERALSVFLKTEKLDLKKIASDQHWMYLATLNLLSLKDFNLNAESLSLRLGIPFSTACRIVNTLADKKLIVEREGKFCALLKHGETSMDIPNEDIQDFHKTILEMSKNALLQEVSTREFVSTTLSFSKKDIKKAKVKIRDFAVSFINEFSNSQGQDCVYQFSSQLYRLDKDLS